MKIWWKRANYTCISAKRSISFVLGDRIVTEYAEATIAAHISDTTYGFTFPWQAIITLPENAKIPEETGQWLQNPNNRITCCSRTAAKAAAETETMLQKINDVNVQAIAELKRKNEKRRTLIDRYGNELDTMLEGRGYVEWEPEHVITRPVYHCGTEECYGPKNERDERDGPVIHLPSCEGI